MFIISRITWGTKLRFEWHDVESLEVLGQFEFLHDNFFQLHREKLYNKMSFLSSLQQVVADVTSSVSNLGISTKMFARENSEPETHTPPPSTGSRARLGPRLVPNPGASLTAATPSRLRSGSTSAQGSRQVATIMRPPNYQQLQSVPPRRDVEVQPLPQLQCGDRYTYWPEYDPAQNWWVKVVVIQCMAYLNNIYWSK